MSGEERWEEVKDVHVQIESSDFLRPMDRPIDRVVLVRGSVRSRETRIVMRHGCKKERDGVALR